MDVGAEGLVEGEGGIVFFEGKGDVASHHETVGYALAAFYSVGAEEDMLVGFKHVETGVGVGVRAESPEGCQERIDDG